MQYSGLACMHSYEFRTRSLIFFYFLGTLSLFHFYQDTAQLRSLASTEHKIWEWQNTTYGYQANEQSPRRWLKTTDANTQIKFGLAIGSTLNRGRPKHQKYRGTLDFAYRQFLPGSHLNYIFHMDLKIKGQKRPTPAKIKLVQKLGRPQVLPTFAESPETKVHLILPLSSVGDRLTKFLSNFEEVCLVQQARVHLVAVVFPQEDEFHKQAGEESC